jgi:SAM-dependent methyltransferase
LRNESEWRPSKIDWKPDGSWRIRTKGVGPGSLLTATIQQEALIPLIERYLRGHIADIGSGNVPFYPGYRDQAESVICVDWGESGHDVGKHSDYLCDLNKGLPLPDASIDSALMSSVLEHIAEPRHLLQELHRCLAPGGYVVIEVPFLYWLHEEPHDYHRFTRYALAAMAEAVGFEVETIAAYGNSFIVMNDIWAKTLTELATSVGHRLPRPVRWRWHQMSYSLIRFYQRIVLVLLARGPMARLLDNSKFQHSFPLGYVAALRKPT